MGPKNKINEDEVLSNRARELFRSHQQIIHERTDRIFAGLMLLQWLGGIFAAYWISPLTWTGAISKVHLHVWLALFYGGAITFFPVFLVFAKPGGILTRHVIAAAQMLMSSLLIQISGGRIETHFHVFGSLAFLAFYRDWRVFIPATLVVGLDHLIRGIYWPQSVYGVLFATPWRSLEHAAWVVFEDIFLIVSCKHSLQEMRDIAMRRAELEAANRRIERTVEERTEELRRALGELEDKNRQLERSGEQRALLANISASSPYPIIMGDVAGHILVWNEAAKELFGWTREEILGRRGMEILVPPEHRDKAQAFVQEAMSGKVVHGELECLAKEGELIPVEMTLSAMRNDQGRVIGRVSILHDLRDIRQLRTSLLQAEKMSAVGQLAAGVAHEINNPLGIILGFAQSMAKRIKADDPIALPAKSIEREALRCKNLVQELLVFSRDNKCKVDKYDLNKILESTLSIIEAQAKVRSVEVFKELGALHPLVGDQNQMQQVIINLCSNAIDAMPMGGRLLVRTRGHAAENGERIILEIEDNGSGIPKEIRDKIFNPFFTTKEVGKGTGLGLSVVYEIIQKHNGTIELRSEVGRGTTFSISLPRDSVAGAERRNRLCNGSRRNGSV